MTQPPHGFDTPWRRVAAALYQRPRDAKIFGTVEFDVTELEEYIARKREEGLKITFTHVFLLAIARGIRDRVPAFNALVRRGRVVPRKQLDASVSVLIPSLDELSSVRIPALDTFTLATLAEFLEEHVQDARSGKEQASLKIKHRLAAIPWPFRGWLIGLVGFLTLDLGLDLSRFGLSNDRFGCFILSHLGSIGLDIGYPSLFPNANVAMVVTLGTVKTAPAYVNGEWVPRRYLPVSAAVDHRVVDGLHIGRLFRQIRKIIARPELLEKH